MCLAGGIEERRKGGRGRGTWTSLPGQTTHYKTDPSQEEEDRPLIGRRRSLSPRGRLDRPDPSCSGHPAIYIDGFHFPRPGKKGGFPEARRGEQKEDLF